jgi:hypothetical protein
MGFGAVAPRTVFLGGDPTGMAQGVHWQHWGAAKSTGFGIGWYPPPGHSVADGVSVTVSLHAFDLGSCNGHRVYRKMSWYFKYGGSFQFGTALGICGGLSYLG